MDVVDKHTWHFPPCMNRHCETRYQFDEKVIIHVKSNLFSSEHPTILMSDMHYHTPVVFRKLAEYFDLSKCVVLTMGDMAGDNNIFGADGNPTEDYEFMANSAREFYFVQGNHDQPCWKGTHLDIKNRCGQKAMIQNGSSVKSLVGKISGVNGIISDRKHPYKLHYRAYLDFMKKGLATRPDIFMTHDTPKVNDGPGQPYIFTLIDKYKPKIHLYGHCHHWDWYTKINNVHYICADARIVVFEPTKVESKEYIIKELGDEYFLETN